MSRAAMVTTLSAFILLSHVAATSASTWTPATACADDPELDLCDVPVGCADDPELDLCDVPVGCADDPEVDLCDELVNACGDDPEVDLCDGPAPGACGDDPEVDLCDGPGPYPTPAPGTCGDDPEVDLCDGPGPYPTPAPGACGDDPEVDLCDGPAPTPAPTPQQPEPTTAPTTAPEPDPTPAPTMATPAPTFPAGTTVVIKQSMSFSSSGTSTEVAAAVVEHLATYMDVPKSACSVTVTEVTARRLTESVPVVAFLSRRLTSSTQWQADYEIQLDDAEKANQVKESAEAISTDPSTFATGMASKFEEAGLAMDASSMTVQPATIATAAEEPSAVATTPPVSSVGADGDAQASTDALVIILILAAIAVIGVVCAAFWLRHFRRSGYQRKRDDNNYDDPESPSNAKEEPMDAAERVAKLGGLWSYKGGNFTLEPVAGAENKYKYNETCRDGAATTGILSQQNPESPWVQGPLDMNGKLFGFIRVQLRAANTATTNFKKQETDEWGANVIANKKDEVHFDVNDTGASGVQASDNNEGVVM